MEGMIRVLALLLLAGTSLAPATAQEAPAAEPVAGPVAEAAPADPVEAWLADPTAVLPADGVDLAAFEFVARPLVVFADSPRQPEFAEQMRLIEADMDELAARGVAVIVDTDPDARSAVRQALRPRGFGLVLIDLDGRVTLRQPAPTTVREVARAIDRSPIRQEETGYRGGGS